MCALGDMCNAECRLRAKSGHLKGLPAPQLIPCSEKRTLSVPEKMAAAYFPTALGCQPELTWTLRRSGGQKKRAVDGGNANSGDRFAYIRPGGGHHARKRLISALAASVPQAPRGCSAEISRRIQARPVESGEAAQLSSMAWASRSGPEEQTIPQPLKSALAEGRVGRNHRPKHSRSPHSDVMKGSHWHRLVGTEAAIAGATLRMKTRSVRLQLHLHPPMRALGSCLKAKAHASHK